jgi:hypothetical protein
MRANAEYAKAGEERSFEVSYPEDFYDKRLAGFVRSGVIFV